MSFSGGSFSGGPITGIDDHISGLPNYKPSAGQAGAGAGGGGKKPLTSKDAGGGGGKPLTSKDAENSDLKKCEIQNNDGSKIMDLGDGITGLFFYESLFEETCRCTVTYGDTGSSEVAEGQSIIDVFPLVGTERINLKLEDALGEKLEFEFFADKIVPISQEASSNLITITAAGEEFFNNQSERVTTRFDGKISDAVEKILKDVLKTNKKLDIEPTGNPFNFQGNNRKCLTTLTWLQQRAVPESSNPGESAGFFLFQTSEDKGTIKFKSVESLMKQEPKKKFLFNESPDKSEEDVPPGYDGKVQASEDEGTNSVKDHQEAGANAGRVVTFDPFNCHYEIIETNKDKIKPENAGKEPPKFNPKFKIGEKSTKTTYMLIDKGTLPTGDSDQQIEKSREQNFKPQDTLSQSKMRMNQMFSIKKSITIPADFSLHVGDAILLDTPEVATKETKEVNPQSGGIYIISDLCHQMTGQPPKTWTKLNLVRDSYGRKPQ